MNGQKVIFQEFFYYILNKPQGVVSATKDNIFKTVVDLLSPADYRSDIFPVGRLDKNTEGLLILTNDGKLGHDLTQPKKHVEKEYFARIDGKVDEAIIERFAKGLTLKNGERVRPAELTVSKTYPSDTPNGFESEINIVIHEGKFHQVKRMFEAVDMYVNYLRRIRMGNLSLPEDLELGHYRVLSPEEEEKLRSLKA